MFALIEISGGVMDLSKKSVALLLLFLAVEAWGASKSLAPWADAVKNKG